MKIKECTSAASSVVGVFLLVGLSIIMVAAVAICVHGFELPPPAPQAKITVVEAKGGLPPLVSFDENMIKLRHKGGDRLDMKKTKLIIYGIGLSYRPLFGGGYVPLPPKTGNVQVFYTNLAENGKILEYKSANGPVLQDGFWSAGETLVLSGEDSINSDDRKSSVYVIVSGDSETSNNYGFKVGEKVYFTVIDNDTNEIVSSTYAIMKMS
ncbi:MAG: type IV pilin N-terminal domain-containing protein [Candidatus Methanoperedens sp.]|nr:type IV pilin N-terminal domain-containing protein [Candidatus Methanoperedens sp.]MCE8428555.1 type IV pilin N-terminal domain-containing protein [Candidatus Methanoperedens sp.]